MEKITEILAQKVLQTVDAGLVAGIGKPVPGQMCVEAAVCFAFGEPHGDEPSCVSPVLRRFKLRLNDANWSSKIARAKGLRRLSLAQLGSKETINEIEFAKQIAMASVNITLPRLFRSFAIANPQFPQLLEIVAQCEKATDLVAADAAAYAAHAVRAAAYAACAAAYAACAAADAAAHAVRAAADADYAVARAAANATTHAARAACAAADAAAHAVRAAAYAACAAADVAANATTHAACAAADAAADAADAFLIDLAEAAVQILIGMNAPGIQWLYLTE